MSEENLLDEAPIIVNENGEILDGQHRVTAALELGYKSVPCLVRSGNLELAQKLNKHTRNWSIMDFAFSYAAQGKKDYQIFLDYKNTWGFGINECLIILSGRHHQTFPIFRAGNFQVRASIAEAKAVAEAIQEYKNIVPNNGYISRGFVLAFLKVYRTKGFSQKRMLHKLGMYPLQRCPDSHMYLDALERIYNYRSPKEERIYFKEEAE